MSRLTAEDYVAHISAESTRFRDVVAATASHARVPACPDWTADDLLWHVAEVQWFWGTVIASRPAGPPDLQPDRPVGREALLGFFDEVSSDLIAGLAAADASEAAWSWADDRTVGFTQRRQAHEALIHRLDAEQTAGAVTPLPMALAADGVAELLDTMYGGEPPSWGSFTPSGLHTAIELDDAGERIRVATGWFQGTHPETGTSYHDAHLLRVGDGPADAVVRGAAADIDAWLWRRRDDTGITVSGEHDAYAEWRAAVDRPLD